MRTGMGGVPLSEPGPCTSEAILSLDAEKHSYLQSLLKKGSEWEGWYVFDD